MTPKDIRNHVAASCGFNKAHYVKSEKASNYANPLYIVTYPDGHTLSTMQESVAIKEVSKFNKAQQGEPTSFSEWLDRNQDSIEPLDRTEATAQWYDEKENNYE